MATTTPVPRCATCFGPYATDDGGTLYHVGAAASANNGHQVSTTPISWPPASGPICELCHSDRPRGGDCPQRHHAAVAEAALTLSYETVNGKTLGSTFAGFVLADFVVFVARRARLELSAPGPDAPPARLAKEIFATTLNVAADSVPSGAAIYVAAAAAHILTNDLRHATA